MQNPTIPWHADGNIQNLAVLPIEHTDEIGFIGYRTRVGNRIGTNPAGRNNGYCDCAPTAGESGE